MTKVLCWRDDCKYLSVGSACGRASISIDEDGECECFADYHDDAEWQNVFWKRMRDRERNQECRCEALGKKLEMGGRVFYVEDRSYYAAITDEETGLIVGDIARLNENDDIIGKIKKEAAKWTPVLELPIALYDDENRKFIYVEDEP